MLCLCKPCCLFSNEPLGCERDSFSPKCARKSRKWHSAHWSVYFPSGRANGFFSALLLPWPCSPFRSAWAEQRRAPRWLCSRGEHAGKLCAFTVLSHRIDSQGNIRLTCFVASHQVRVSVDRRGLQRSCLFACGLWNNPCVFVQYYDPPYVLLFYLKTVMDFRHPDGRSVSVLLPERSLLVMKGESRFLWTHGYEQITFNTH